VAASSLVWILIAAAIVAANLPWLSERLFFVIPLSQGKRVWMRLLEWLSMYLLIGMLAIGLENKTIGSNHPQDWEFYTINFFIFMVFAFPGFIYRHDLLKHIQKR